MNPGQNVDDSTADEEPDTFVSVPVRAPVAGLPSADGGTAGPGAVEPDIDKPGSPLPDESSVAATRERPTDQRMVVSYLHADESDHYIAIMRVLEAAVIDMTPAEVAGGLREAGVVLETGTVERRLDRLYQWGATDRAQDNTNVRVVADLLAKNFRYAPTGVGRQVQRFYEQYLTVTAPIREIAITSLNTVVTELEALADPSHSWSDHDWVRQRVDNTFNAHDSLDTTLISAESSLMGLASRFDLDDDQTGELKGLLVRYATHAVNEVEVGSERASVALSAIADRFDQLAAITVAGSRASELIARNVLGASRGGHDTDWLGLTRWYDPDSGRGARFARRILAAVPTFHANLRRLHTTGTSRTTRSRALLLARACLNPDAARQVYLAALGDHSWRKLHGESEDPGAGRTLPWRAGPQVEVEKWQFSVGRTGSRGKAPAPLDDTAEREIRAIQREQAKQLRQRREAEVLATLPGQAMSAGAGRVAYEVLTAAIGARPSGGRRTARRGGLACTIAISERQVGTLGCPLWRVWLPGRVLVFHIPDAKPVLDGVGHDDGAAVQMLERKTA